MKSITLNFLTILLVLTASCKKEESGLNHAELITQKILNQDNEAFVGKWERIETKTWDYNDNYISDFTREPLKITKKQWITEGSKRNYSIDIFPTDCDIYVTVLSLETRGEEIIVPFSTYGWGNQLRFKVYEYPEDPTIFRIDKIYKPAGQPD
jgi:hypothetical protein